MTEIRCRFAPSNTGSLHVGGARTAIINYLYVKQNAGKLFLRIEDTDLERSKPEHIETIFKSLKWLGITYDGEPVIQSKNLNRHTEVAQDMLLKNTAYRCFCTSEELDAHREYCTKNSIPPTYSRKCRKMTDEEINQNLSNKIPFTVRVKVPDEDKYITVNDLVKGKVSVHYNQLDDFIILRSDNTPVYMLSVVVDDYDMNITHTIRGEDHFTNTFRQTILFKLNNWSIPTFGHLPLIYGSDGKKLSKRLNAVGTDDYKNMGYLAEALKIYLATMGTSINVTDSFDDLIKNFKINKLSKSPTQFDINFLGLINQKVMKKSPKPFIIEQLTPFLEQKLERLTTPEDINVIERAYPDIISRGKSLVECAEFALLYFQTDQYDKSTINMTIYDKLNVIIHSVNFESNKTIKDDLVKFATNNEYAINDITNLLRTIITGKENCPSTYSIMYALGKKNTIFKFNL
jgi:glutamyl-tRNA synthetase